MIAPRDIPKAIWIHTIIIIAFGLVALYSATVNNVRVGQGVFYDQLTLAALGLVLMYAISRGHYRFFYDGAYIAYGLNLSLLLLVLFMGREALGATRWISIGGFSFQPSEFSKIAMMMFLARYFSSRKATFMYKASSGWWGLCNEIVAPLVLTLISALLIFKQPDLGTAILVMGIFLAMFYVSGVHHRLILIMTGVVAILMPFAWHFLRPYQRSRLLVFLNPDHDPLGAGYTVIQSKIAVGSGQLFGKGWLSGSQSQLNFLPERHTDFIFSVIGEEWGLIGAGILLYCYIMIIDCALTLATHHKDRFAQMMAVGIASILAMQVVINIAMNIGLCPVVGIPLPLLSYGRTSFIVFIVMLGFLLNLCQRRKIF